MVESRLSTVSREITDSRVKTREEFDALYRKIISYTLLLSRMGSPADVNTMQEAAGYTLTRNHSQLKYSDNVTPAGVQGKGIAIHFCNGCPSAPDSTGYICELLHFELPLSYEC